MPRWWKPGFSLAYFFTIIYLLSLSIPRKTTQILFISVPWDFVFNFLSCSCAPYFQPLPLHLILDVIIFQLYFRLRLYPTRSFFLAFFPSLFPGYLPSFCPPFPPQTLPPFSHCYETLLRISDRVVTSKSSISLASPWLLKRLISDCLLEHCQLSWERRK